MLRTALRATALATTAVIAASVPAHAAKLVLTDPAGDVWAQAETSTQIGTRVNGDLVKTVVNHTAKRVVVKAKYTDLRKTADTFGFIYYLRTNEGVRRGVDVLAGPGHRRGVSELTKGRADKKVACAGLTHAVDYTANTVTLSVPRSCLSNPRWVQVQPGAVTLSSSDFAFTIDDAQSTSSEPHTWSAKVRRG